MTPQTDQRMRNIEGLRRAAQQKADRTRCRAEEAIALLVRQQRPVNFKTVAQTGQVSTAWLYGPRIAQRGGPSSEERENVSP
jgi:hypothetical protein